MKSFAFCPVSEKRINERVARVNAALTVVLIGVFAVTQNIIPILFLALDFLFRSADNSRYSLISISSKGIVKYLAMNEYLINAGPKLFAARIGFLFSVMIIITYIIGASVPAFMLAGTLGIFSFLESALGICVACEIYPYVHRLIRNK